MAAFLPLFLSLFLHLYLYQWILRSSPSLLSLSLQSFPSSMESSNPSLRSSKKRVSGEQSLQLATTNKRVVLGEITNSLAFNPSQSSVPDRELEKEKPDLNDSGSSIDSKKSDPLSCIYRHLRSLEIESHKKVSPDNIEKVGNSASDSSFSRVRGILIDWLVEVAEEYKLVSDTLYLTISLIDRFLASHAVDRNKLQLLGVCCMLIASKYEEISPPHVEDFCYITDNTYTKKEVLDMEREVHEFLSCEICAPTIKNFLRIFTKVGLENWKVPNLEFELLSCYLAELSLLDYRCVQFLPSVIAASAIFLSIFTIQPEKHPWSLALQCYSGYRPSELMECILAIHDLQLNRKGSSLQAVRVKYKQHKFQCVATLSPPSEIPAHYFEDIDKPSSKRFSKAQLSVTPLLKIFYS